MDSLRRVPAPRAPAILPCCRCASAERNWDRIAGKAYCPDCQEGVILGLTAPLAERAEKNCCAVCNAVGTVRYLTFPLQSALPVEMDLCPEHIRELLGRRLGPSAFHQLRRRLVALGLGAESIFLLHGAFYDPQGRALQPATEPE
jgi:hypothetical protein